MWTSESAEQAFSTAANEFSDRLDRHTMFVTVRQDLRNLIRQQNAKEIDQLVADRKFLLDMIGVQRTIKDGSSSSSITTPEALAKKIEANREKVNVYGLETVTISVVNESDRERFSDTINQFQLEVDRIEDQLTTANATSKVPVTEEVLAFLTAQHLM